MILFKNFKLMAAADDGAGSGGGDDLESKIAAAVAAALPKALNGAITAHQKRQDAKWEERFKALEGKGAGGGDGDDDAGDGGDASAAAAKPKPGAPGALPPEVAAEIAALKKRLEKSDARAKEAEDRRLAEEAKRLTNEERSALSKVLGEKKVAPEMLEVAVALLHTEQKRVARGEGGKLAWRGDDGDELDLAAGVDSFLKTPTGQRFLPATGAGGGGSGPGTRPGAVGGDPHAGKSLLGMIAEVGAARGG